jgi:hypothetical protein
MGNFDRLDGLFWGYLSQSRLTTLLHSLYNSSKNDAQPASIPPQPVVRSHIQNYEKKLHAVPIETNIFFSKIPHLKNPPLHKLHAKGYRLMAVGCRLLAVGFRIDPLLNFLEQFNSLQPAPTSAA